MFLRLFWLEKVCEYGGCIKVVVVSFLRKEEIEEGVVVRKDYIGSDENSKFI